MAPSLRCSPRQFLRVRTGLQHTLATLQLYSQHKPIELAVGRGQDLYHFDQILDEEVEVVHVRMGEETLGCKNVPKEGRRVIIRTTGNTGKRTTMKSIGDATDPDSDMVDLLSLGPGPTVSPTCVQPESCLLTFLHKKEDTDPPRRSSRGVCRPRHPEPCDKCGRHPDSGA